jgi:preprotein translocase subunit SecF
MFNTLKYYKFWFAVSGIILVFGIVSLSMFGLNLGIDFKGGTLSELKFDRSYELSSVEKALKNSNVHGFMLQPSENNVLLVKTPAIEKEKHDELS